MLTRILIVDDHDLVRTGLRSILETREDCQVVAECDSGETAIQYFQRQSELPMVVLMDVNMPGIGGIEATRRIHQHWPDVHVVAVTALQDEPFPAQLLKAGAAGYVTKGCPAEELFQAIDTVMSGQQYLANPVSEKNSLDKINGSEDISPFASLSDREMQVMLMITQGHSNQQISDSLFLSPKTISTYRSRVFDKLNIANDVELTHMAIRHGIIDQ